MTKRGMIRPPLWCFAALLLLSSKPVLSHPVDDVDQQVFLEDDGDYAVAPATARSKTLHGRFLHISDFHPDQFYEPHTSPEDGITCHRKTGSSGYYGAEKTDCDSPATLVNATFDWIAENLIDKIDFIVWTGDTARHDGDEKIPRHAEQVLDTNTWVANKFVELLSGKPGGNGKMHIPIVPNLGNNDFLPHNIFTPGPNKWLRYYDDIWKRFIPEEQKHAFQFGGWFYVEVIPNKLAVFSLNTMYFFDRNAGVDGCAARSEPGYMHLEWLRIHLQMMRQKGMKAILIGHVPPARTDNKQNWAESCWQKYTLWVHNFRDVITASLYGHMNIDHFVVHDSQEVDLSMVRTGRHSSTKKSHARSYIDSDVTIQSKDDYLQDLRHGWSKLPRHIGAKSAHGPRPERYHLSLVGPSIVPNYFPTLRVYEYDTTGLEKVRVWEDGYEPHKKGTKGSKGKGLNQHDSVIEELKRGIEFSQLQADYENLNNGDDDDDDDNNADDNFDADRQKKGGRKKKNGKKPKRPERPHDPNLIIPDPPPSSAPLGPAYAVQSLSLINYAQYFANLTKLNNDIRDGDGTGMEKGSARWDRDPEPLPFEFEVEYNTTTDKKFKLPDLTVGSYVELAARIAKTPKKKKNDIFVEVVEENNDDEDNDLYEDNDDEDEDESEDQDNQVETGKDKGKDKKKKHKKKKGGNKKNHNKLWLEFLNRAFVQTVSKKKLKKSFDE